MCQQRVRRVGVLKGCLLTWPRPMSSSPDDQHPEWVAAPMPPDEPARLAALHEYQILDTPPEQVFDDLTWLASFICQTPMALVTLIDHHRQWFKPRVGFDATESP